ncbi:MAG: hypothetical protein EOM11_09990 [Erysipelotrichia bacterium]|nr:hypothetical protein [Erysipelotrichia bacterium]
MWWDKYKDMELTVIFKEIEFEVGFDYQPEEPMVRYYSDGTGYPGCASAIEGIWKVEHKGTDFIPFLDEVFGEGEWEKEIEDELWRTMENEA